MEFITDYFIQIGLGVSMIVNLYLGYQRIQLGGYAIRKEIFEDYKERNKQLEDKIKLLGDRMTDMALQLTKLETTIIEKDNHIASLTKLVENRNPQLISVLEEIKIFLSGLEGMVVQNQKELLYQTDILDQSVARDKNIEVASENKTGNPTRIDTK